MGHPPSETTLTNAYPCALLAAPGPAEPGATAVLPPRIGCPVSGVMADKVISLD
jgi:hypothetical protein